MQNNITPEAQLSHELASADQLLRSAIQAYPNRNKVDGQVYFALLHETRQLVEDRSPVALESAVKLFGMVFLSE